jgi:RNA polymerase sigma factor (sigma-70 family)
MVGVPVSAILRHIQRLADPPTEQTDGQLLQRFVGQRDEAAFVALLRRHSRLVWSVCRHRLHHEHDAEDAFQATFLILARQAAAIRKSESVASWLHGVAYRIARKAVTLTAHRRRRERRSAAAEAQSPPADLAARELQALLDEELERLPAKCRAAFILCCLQGRSRKEAAAELGWKEGTLSCRIAQARRLLQKRLVRRGVTLSAALTAGLLWGQPASAALLDATRRTVSAVAAGRALSVVTNPGVAALVSSGLNALASAKAKLAIVLTLAAIVSGGLGLAGGVGILSRQPPEAKPAEEQPKQSGTVTKADVHGDPLPAGAVMRLGTLQRRAVEAKLAMSADGQSIIGVRGGKYIYVWDAADCKLRYKRELPGESFNCWLSADGRWLAREAHPAFTVWDVAAAKEVHSFAIKGARYVMPVIFSEDGKKVAAAGQGEKKILFAVWDLTTGKEIFAKEVPTQGGAGQIAFTTDSKRLFGSVMSIEEGIHCWDLASGELVWQNKEFVPSAMAFTPDGKILTPQEKYRAVDAATGQRAEPDKMPPLTWDTRPTLTPDGRTLLLSTADGVIVWDMVNGKELHMLAGAGEELIVGPDSKTIITNNGALQRWDLATGKPLYTDNFEAGHIGDVSALAFSADGKSLASTSADGSVRLWDTTTGKPLHVWRGHEARRPVRLWRWMKAGVTALDISPDGRWVLSAGSEERLFLRDAITGKEVRSIPLPLSDRGESERRVFDMRISSDGKRATALFGAQGFTHVVGQPEEKHSHKLATWDLPSGKLVGLHPIEIRQTEISPDGRTLLSDELLLDVASGKETARLEGGSISGMGGRRTFSADCALLVGAFAAQTTKDGITMVSPAGVRIWETATGKTAAHLKTKSWVAQVAFHPNNRYVATNDLDGIQVWDALTGKVVLTRPMPEHVRSSTTNGSYASCLAFTADGRRLATGHPDGTILVWDVPLPRATPKPLAADELDALWTDLASSDAAKAWRAVWLLRDAPSTMQLLRERIQPVAPAPVDQVRDLIADLDNESFERRQAAVKRLKGLGQRAAPALRQELEANPTAEKKRRIQEVLAALETPQPLTADALRQLRAIMVLERIGNQEAREALTILAKGAGDARLTREAKAALERARR